MQTNLELWKKRKKKLIKDRKKRKMEREKTKGRGKNGKLYQGPLCA